MNSQNAEHYMQVTHTGFHPTQTTDMESMDQNSFTIYTPT